MTVTVFFFFPLICKNCINKRPEGHKRIQAPTKDTKQMDQGLYSSSTQGQQPTSPSTREKQGDKNPQRDTNQQRDKNPVQGTKTERLKTAKKN